MMQAQPPEARASHALNAIKAKFNSEVAVGLQTQSSAPLAPTLSVHRPNTVLVHAAVPAPDLNATHATTCNALVTINTGQVSAAVQVIQLPTNTNATRTSRAHKILDTYHPIPRTESVQRVHLASINHRQHTGNRIALTQQPQQPQPQPQRALQRLEHLQLTQRQQLHQHPQHQRTPAPPLTQTRPPPHSQARPPRQRQPQPPR